MLKWKKKKNSFVLRMQKGIQKLPVHIFTAHIDHTKCISWNVCKYYFHIYNFSSLFLINSGIYFLQFDFKISWNGNLISIKLPNFRYNSKKQGIRFSVFFENQKHMFPQCAFFNMTQDKYACVYTCKWDQLAY